MTQTISISENTVETSLSVENWSFISQLFGFEAPVDGADEVDGANEIEVETETAVSATTGTTPVSLSSFLHYGQLTVVASDNEGVLFTNPTDLEVQVTFIPDINGIWPIERPRLAQPPKEPEIVWLDSRGDNEDGSNDAFIAPSRPLGAILFRRESWSDQYEEVGTQLTKRLDPEENVYLVCNFYREGYSVPENLAADLYSSNDNSITVWWFLEAAQEEPTRGEFTVEAASGFLFRNDFDRALTFYFIPEGTWQVFGEDGKELEYIGYTTTMLDAGYSYLLPHSPVGCLLVGRGETIKVDEGDLGLDAEGLVPLKDQRSWSLEPGETILFVCNGNLSNITKSQDVPDGDFNWTFGDHFGEITIKWTVMEVS
ncbi:MAG: hypothetical protein AAF921_04920 [Cyanobacteria bacterium P01_D01_bin.44]